jgi:hypothetical protein
MNIDVTREPLLTMAEAAKLLPSPRGGTLSAAAVKNWASRGVKSAGGRNVRLRTIRVGRMICTTAQAIQEFCNSLSDDTGEPKAARAPEAAVAYLEAEGL